MTKFNFDGMIEELTPFFLRQGFEIDKTLFKEKERRGFIKPYSEYPDDFCFCRFAPYYQRTKAEMGYGVKLSRMTKYIQLLGLYVRDDTLYQRGKILSYFVDSEDLFQKALSSYETAYFNWCIPFFEQNDTPRGVFESIRFSGMDHRGIPSDEVLRTGKKHTCLNDKELDLFLTKVFAPEEIEERVAFIIADAARVRHILATEHDIPIEADSESRLIAHLNGILAKIETIDIETARKELIY